MFAIQARFDRRLRDELAAKEATLLARRDELNDAILQRRESDGWDSTDAKMLRHKLDVDELREVRAELQETQGELRQQNMLDTDLSGDAEIHPLARFMSDGHDGLEEWEQKRYAPTAEDMKGLKDLPRGVGRDTQMVCIDGMLADSRRRMQSGPMAAQVATDVAGSMTGGAQDAVQTDVMPVIYDRLANFGGPSRFCYQWDTPDTRPRKFPQSGDTVVGDRQNNQRDAATEGDWELQSVTATPDRYSSKYCDVSNETITDLAPLGIESFVGSILIRRIGRKQDLDHTRGVASESLYNLTGQDGVTVTTAQTVTFDNIIDTPFTIDRAYRDREGEAGMGGFMAPGSGQTGWIFADGMEARLMKMKDSDGRPIWKPTGGDGMNSMYPGMINGFPYVVAGQASALANGQTMALFGNFSYYGIRNCRRIVLLRFFDSGTANSFATRFLAFAWRWQGPLTQQYSSKYDWLTKLVAGS